MQKTPVIFNHDAAIDEYMAAILLTTMEEYDLRGIVITNADCIDSFAMQVMWKIQSYINNPDIPLALSDARGLNPFPWPYRGDCIREDGIAALWDYDDNPAWPPFPSGEELMIKQLTEAYEKNEPVTLLINCPLTTLGNILREHPELEKGISRMIWMGGAINVPGNLDPTTLPPQVANPTAEWNVFWDPPSTEWVLQNTSFPITVFPLDVTDQAAISPDFMSKLQAQSKASRYSRLAYESYQLVAAESFYDMWDVVTTCYLTRPEFFDPPSAMKLSVVTEGFYQGTLHQTDGGRKVDVILNLKDSDGFYDYVLKQFNRN
jgi:purine nucleosidase